MVRQDNAAAQRYAEQHLSIHIAEPFAGLIVERKGEMSGAVILNDYSAGRNIELTVHACGPWSVSDVREIARYCFRQVRRITARTAVNNDRAARMLEILGFKREGILREWFGETDAIVFGLLRSEQRIFHER